MKQVEGEFGLPVALKFTVHGEHVIRRKDKVDSAMPLEKEEYTKDKLSSLMHDHMGSFFEMVQQVDEMKERKIPLTRNEVKKHIPKAAIKSLVKKGLLQERIIAVKAMVQGHGVNTGGKSVVYFTALGRGYVGKFFDEEYYNEKS